LPDVVVQQSNNILRKRRRKVKDQDVEAFTSIESAHRCCACETQHNPCPTADEGESEEESEAVRIRRDLMAEVAKLHASQGSSQNPALGRRK